MASVARTGIACIKDYYRRITEVDIAAIARELLDGRILQESDQLLRCNCPHHASDSKTSLHVMLDKQGWYCFGCQVGGDVLQLVEFIQSGEATRGANGPMPESHRAARDFLADRVGLPPLSSHGLTEEQLKAAEEDRALEGRVFGVLTVLAGIYHERLLAEPKVLAWFRQQYGISEQTIWNLKIGYAENTGIIKALTSGPETFTLRELSASAAFRPTAQDGLDPFFDRRVVFPYWSRGRVAFLIGRKTPWTPDSKWETGKYKKLPVGDRKQRAHVAPCIRNSHLFNEDVLLTRPDRVVITEGVTDCISLIEHGFPTVSPATVQIRSADWERLLPKLRGVKTVYIAQDNEVSGVGLEGALKTARVLREHDIDTRVVVLPLDETQQGARRTLDERFGITTGSDAREVKKRLDELSEADRTAANDLLARAKIDVNAFFAAGHTTEEFEALLAAARTPIELAIDGIPTDTPEDERNRRLEPVYREIATLAPIEQSRHLRLLQSRFGKTALPMRDLRRQISAIERDRRTEERKKTRRAKLVTDAPSGSCRAVIDQALAQSIQETGYPDFARAAEAAYAWFSDHGARFFRTPAGEPFMFLNNALLWMDSGERARRRSYLAVVYKHTGLAPTTTGGRTFYDVLASLASDRGEVRAHFSCLHTNVTTGAVYFNLFDPDHRIAKITAEGVEILKNGGNDDGIILSGSEKMAPINYLPDADPAEADRLFKELVIDNLACSRGDRLIIVAWLSCGFLIDFAGTRPMMRFEGPASSGKTTASKIISTLIYGSPQQKKSTDAANYTDGSRNPLIVLDNIEAKQMTEELTTFMLTCVTGITKEKRKGGTDTETVVERTNCLLNTTGIEPLGGELSEILSRSFVIRFDLDDSASDCFLESKVLARIRESRDVILSVLMKRTSTVLKLLASNAQERVMTLLHATLGNHGKRRANDYLALMYLMMIAGEPEADVEAALTTLDDRFLDQIRALNVTTQDTAQESNPTATALAALFHVYETTLEADQAGELPAGRSNESLFRERYQIRFADRWTIRAVRARVLFVALKRVAREFHLAFPMSSVQQFVQRFANDVDTIRRAGFNITVNAQPGRSSTYDITQE